MAEVEPHSTTGLTSTRRLVSNVAWSLVGHGAPLLVAVGALPVLIAGLGTERFGVLSLAWVIVGYFSLCDLGMSRALTKLVAEKLGEGNRGAVPALVWSGVGATAALGTLAGLLVAALAPWLSTSALRIPESLQSETTASLVLLAASLPLVTSGAALRGVLEAYQAFGATSLIRTAMGLYMFLSPIAALWFSPRLDVVVGLLVVGRAVAWLIHLGLCMRLVSGLGARVAVDWSLIRPLLHFGGWMTVSNIIGPVLLYLDRFLIGALISAAAVAYYTVPYEVMVRLLVVPTALVGVLFPAFATSLVGDRMRARTLFARGVQYLFLTLFPIVVLVVALAREGLAIWLGPEFAEHGARALQWLAIGVLLNGVAYVPFAAVQAAGRPDLTAKLHVVELPLYVVAVVWLLGAYGLEGAAVAWAGRAAVDMACLFVMARGLLPPSSVQVWPAAVGGAGATVALTLAMAAGEPLVRAAVAAAALVGCGILAWRALPASLSSVTGSRWLSIAQRPN